MDTTVDDKPKQNGTLPDPELNPMLNPTLGKNLGRWAQVYFTSPPEQREQAVQELLKELERSEGKYQESRSFEVATKKENAGLEGDLESRICSACRHRNSRDQRFCGFCGFSLQSENAAAGQGMLHAAPAAARVDEARPAVERRDDNWQWLHEKNLAELAAAQEKPGRLLKYILLFLTLIAIPAGYALWRTTPRPTLPKPGATVPNTPAPRAAPVQAPASTNAPATVPVPAPATGAVSSPGKAPGPGESRAVNGRAAAQNASNLTQPAVSREREKAAPSFVSHPPGDEGQQEFSQGRRLLNGQGAGRDHAEAAKWLWRSVAKQNTEAILLLADMYVRGDGVPQSCDQARVLLMAGIRRGSATAGEKLRAMTNTCP